jgi:hypothetical protein
MIPPSANENKDVSIVVAVKAISRPLCMFLTAVRERVFPTISRAAFTTGTNFTTAFRKPCHATHEDIDGDLFRDLR